MTAVMNGVLEEVLWRGLPVALFPGSCRWAVLWPAVWFGAWHLAPGRVALGERAWVLAVGAAALGRGLGLVAWATRSIRWTVLSHTLAGVVQA
jgi:membrane protease YdiL (CAAX protease family)